MHPTRRDRGLRLGAMILMSLAFGGSALHGQEPAPQPRPAGPQVPPPARTGSGALIVPIGISQRLQMASRKPISTVRLNVEGIVRVAPDAADPSAIILTGVTAGTVRLFLTDIENREEINDIIVQLDVTYLKQIIRNAVPTANVEVMPVLNRTVILTGWVAKAEDVDVILRVASTVVGSGANVVNAMQVGGVMQVQLDVTVAQVNRSKARRRGFAFAYDGNEVSVGSILGGLVTSNAGAGGAGGAAAGVGVIPSAAQFNPGLLPTGPNIVFGVVQSNIQLLLQALKDESIAKLLAEPKLVTLSGRPARFLSGGQQAILSASGGLGGPGVAFRDVGTELDFLPVVLGNGRIYLEVAPVVRRVNNGRGLTTAFGFVPGFDEQSVRTAIELEPGQTMAIGGLIQTEVNATSQRVPLLGDLPFVGSLFSTVTHLEDEVELVVLVTPHLVDGQDCKQAPKRLPGRETRSPDDYELFLEGLLEAPRGQRQVFVNGEYKAAYKNDPSIRQYPCAEPLPREPRPARRQAGCDTNCVPSGTMAPPLAPATAAPSVLPSPSGVGSTPVPTTVPGTNVMPEGGYPVDSGSTTNPAPIDPRTIPPSGIETLPTPPRSAVNPGRAAVNGTATRPTSTSRSGPVIPAPQLDDEPPR